MNMYIYMNKQNIINIKMTNIRIYLHISFDTVPNNSTVPYMNTISYPKSFTANMYEYVYIYE